LLTNAAYYVKSEVYTQTEVNSQISTGVSSYLPLAGGTMTGTLNVTQASTADTIKLTRGTTAHNNMIKFVTGSTDKWIVGQRNDNTDHFRFYSYGTSSDVLSIKTDGKVGIGTTSPATQLTVAGDMNIPAVSLSNLGDSHKLYFGNEVTVGPGKGIFMEDFYIKIQGHRNEGIRLQGVNGSGVVQEFATFYGDANAKASQIILAPTAGNVGIGTGTASPGYKLQVDHGTGSEYASSIRNTNDNLQLLLGTTTGGLLNIQGKTINNNTAYDIALQAEGGKVGIGTTSPDRLLDVSGTGNVYGKFQSTNATGAGIQVKDSVEDFLIQADGANDGGLAIYDLGRTTYRWRINSSGVTVPDKLQPSTYEPNIKWVQVTGGFNGSGGTAATSMTWYPITNQSINNYNSDYSGGDRGVNFMIKWTSGNVNRGYHHTVSGHIPILSANAYIGYQNATYSTQASGTSMSEGLNLNICHHTGCASGHNIQCRLFGDGTNYGNIYLQIRAEATPQNGDAYISFWKV